MGGSDQGWVVRVVGVRRVRIVVGGEGEGVRVIGEGSGVVRVGGIELQCMW